MGAIFSNANSSSSAQFSIGTHGNVHLIKDRSQWTTKLSDAKDRGKVVVVDFTASWCGPCRFIAPFFAELSEKYPNLVFLKVDVDELSDISQEYDVHAMPTFMFIQDGKVKEKLVGANKAELENKVKHYSQITSAA